MNSTLCCVIIMVSLEEELRITSGSKGVQASARI
jgi:hypothetical protein